MTGAGPPLRVPVLQALKESEAAKLKYCLRRRQYRPPLFGTMAA